MWRLWECLWPVRLALLRIRCWFRGHDQRLGNPLNYEAPYCDACDMDWPDDEPTLPHYLNRVYCCLVERDWAWFERFDNWFREHHQKHLPRWWEY